jgi:glycosyltransferase involved in cell wall biosynthesis
VTRPLVSIVTTSYEHAPYLEETLRSVLEQDYPRVEYLVIDDGSTDESPEIVRRYAGRLAWWSCQENEGQVAALNRAFSHATGDLLGFVNSDDTLLPGAVSRMVAEFERDPELLLVYGSALWTDERSEQVGTLEAGEWDAARLARTGKQPVPQPASLWTRRAWELAGPFNPDSWSLFDTEFYLRLAVAGRAVRVSGPPLATFRLHPGSKSMSRFERMADECVRFAEEFYGGPDFPAALRRYARQGRASFYRRAALNCYAAGDLRRSRRLFARSLLLSPRGLDRKQASRLLRSFVPERVVRRRRAG